MKDNYEIYTTSDLRDFIDGHNVMGDIHFFNPEAIRFLNSRIGATIYKNRYFVTSERRNSETPRRYTVRKFDLTPDVRESDGREMTRVSIDTVGEFQQFTTRNAAIRYIESL